MSRNALAVLAVACCLAASPAAGATADALYEVVFTATWSAATHPDGFPSFAHFSPLIGGTHDDQVAFWAAGDTASLGLRRMAEWGAVSPLDQEVQAAILAGHAGEVIASDGFVFSPGVLATTFTATAAAPLVTLVTMVAPSPDWFVGVAGLDLRDGDGWVAELTVDLLPWDAGTDSGPDYTSPNQATIPQQPVAAITGSPFAPGVPLGTFTFRRLAPAAVPAAAALGLRAYPNPFNPRARIDVALPAAGPVAVDVCDLRGRRVRTLWGGRADAGTLSLGWDGQDDAGRGLASGVYLVRARSGGAAATIRLVLAR